MSVIAITGNHPRHTYLVNSLAEAGLLSGWVKQIRAPFIPSPPEGLSEHLAELFKLHFQRRETAENRFFGDAKTPDVPTLEVTKETLNDKETIDFLSHRDPRIVLSYGCHKLSDALMNESNSTFWNTHGGLSPEYRGVTTHFWPSYMLEPQMTGMTLHETTSKIDGGGIIHQTAVPMVKGDGLHDVAGRTVKTYADELPSVLKKCLKADSLPVGKKQRHTDKIWMSSDWRPEHLTLIYEMFEDRIVDRVLDGTLAGRLPKLVSVLN